MKSVITLDDVKVLNIRVGTVRGANPPPDARIPALRLKIDFGGRGIRNSRAVPLLTPGRPISKGARLK